MNAEIWDAPWLRTALDLLLQVLPAIGIAILAVVSIGIANNLLLKRARHDLGETGRLIRQLAVAAVAIAGLISFVVALPIADAMRVQLLSLLGVVVSAALALSSTTLIGNAMAGLMLRFVGQFRIGDFVEIEGHLGRVTHRGLLHIEIQTEDSDLEMLPNSFLVTHPLKVVRGSGTIVSAQVSLGYDVPRTRVAELLNNASEAAGLSDAFVQIIELGDYSISYRAAGFLADPRTLISARSRLRGCMIDSLHAGGVEIVSPSFVNQQRVDGREPIIPRGGIRVAKEVSPENVIFDKAEAAASVAELRSERDELRARLKEIGELLEDAAADRAAELSGEKSRIQARLDAIEAAIDELDAEQTGERQAPAV